MAAQVDLLRAKVEKERLRSDSLQRLMIERKRRRRKEEEREGLHSAADKRERREKEAKKEKLHHHHHQQQQDEHLSHQPSQQQQNLSAGKHVPQGHQNHRHQQQQHRHRLADGSQKKLRLPAECPPAGTQLQQQVKKQRALPPEPPALFAFTPLKTVKAKPQDAQDRHRDKEAKVNRKKENAEVNVKHELLRAKTGEVLRGLARQSQCLHHNYQPYLQLLMLHF